MVLHGVLKLFQKQTVKFQLKKLKIIINYIIKFLL